MLQNFESVREYQPPYPTNDYNTQPSTRLAAAEYVSEPRSHKVIKGIGIVALYGALSAVSALSSDVAQGIQDGKERVAHDRPSVHTVYSYPDTSDVFSRHATVVLTGLGTKDASETAASLEAHRDVGSVYAIEYSNQNLDTRDIALGIVEQAHSDGVTHVSLDGYSMGGPIALDIATQFNKQHDAPEVVSVVLNSSPIGENALTVRSAQGVDIMENVLSLHRDLVYYDKGLSLIHI